MLKPILVTISTLSFLLGTPLVSAHETVTMTLPEINAAIFTITGSQEVFEGKDEGGDRCVVTITQNDDNIKVVDLYYPELQGGWTLYLNLENVFYFSPGKKIYMGWGAEDYHSTISLSRNEDSSLSVHFLDRDDEYDVANDVTCTVR